MNNSLSEKEKLISMLTNVCEQLEEMELVLEASFSDLRSNMNLDELKKLSIPVQRLEMIETKFQRGGSVPIVGGAEDLSNPITRSLKLEMGF